MEFTRKEIHALERIARDADLEGVDVFDDFTDDEKLQSFNGTGGTNTPEWERWLLTKLTGDKLAAVYIHDLQYRRGGTEEDRLNTNRQLSRNFLKLHKYDSDHGRFSFSPWWNWASRKTIEATDSDEAKGGWGVA